MKKPIVIVLLIVFSLGFIVSAVVLIVSAAAPEAGQPVPVLRSLQPIRPSRPATDWNAIIATLSALVTFIGAVLTLVAKARKDDLEIKKMRLELDELRKKVNG